jgi:hypothetical protein
MSLSHIVYPALKVILVNRLQKSLPFGENGKPVPPYLGWDSYLGKENCRQLLPSSHSTRSPEIPIQRIQQRDRVCYGSAIALKLSQQQGLSASEVAHQITNALRQTIEPSTSTEPHLSIPIKVHPWHKVELQILSNLIITVESRGWIYLTLADRGLAAWLQGLIDFTDWGNLSKQRNFIDFASIPTTLNPDQVALPKALPKAIDPFQILHSHARCCGLLRLGMRENLISLHYCDRPTQSPFSLTSSCFTPQTLQFQHATERLLIEQFIDSLDRLSTPSLSPLQHWRLAQNLSQAFYEFHANCPIFGASQTLRQLAQARLGLVFICQQLLWFLLKRLQVDAPIEL